ncbi:enoyl-CoA hydratase-related protein [Microtetraspora sp. NBRC 16547]|uniref:enoyl-CoA hydratase-related protein n=1 Tax=Microtetraspora sp. NBRC 16547 TaxID=3030993 RepID=UPI00249FF8CE|nr:enoyl-CoA hydratase-related protein [Microtetraspora sp. NBRC 16547]GLW99315.1 enoyl-CoA hydratase [Microtetraspora sp. NBRC 16547]
MSEQRFEGYRGLRVERDGYVLRVTISNPRSELNAIDEHLHEELGRLFAELKTERDARVVLLRSEGRVFSAGGDFSWFEKLRADGTALETLRHDAKQLIWDLLDIEVPIVVALHGHTMGLAATIALMCDWVVMAEDALIGDPHVRIGVAAGDGGAAIWPLILGPLRAKQYLLTGNTIGAAEAERIGLVNEMVTLDRFEARVEEVVSQLGEQAPLAVRYTKISVNKLIKESLNIAFDTSLALELVTIRSDDQGEAMAAKAERRAPKFAGR